MRCSCQPPDRKKWRVMQFKCNHSAFNGYKRTPSDYSSVRCTKCGHWWRTKAEYVIGLKMEEGA